MQAVTGLYVYTRNYNAAMHMHPTWAPSRAFYRARPTWVPETEQSYLVRSSFTVEKKLPKLRIPHIIHQSWKTWDLKPFQVQWQKTWIENHPTWTYKFWTDKDNRKLIAEKFPQFLSIYDNLPSPIERADCARYFYMLEYGGVYFDLDFESLKPLEPLLEPVQVGLGYMTQNTSHPLSIPNAFLASVPGHNFWWYVIKHVLRNYESGLVDRGDPLRVSGPYMIKEAVHDYQSTSLKKDLTIFPQTQVYGVDYNWYADPNMQHLFSICHASDPSFNSTQCKMHFPDAYSITYWSGDLTWGG